MPVLAATRLYLEDLIVGQRFAATPVTVSADEIRAFAAQFDPQPFHMDSAAASTSFFGGLVASGWHTASLTMRMLVEALPFAGGTIGTRVELRWPAPVHPADTLSMEAEVMDARASARRPGYGIVRLQVQTRNQAGALVMEMTTVVMVERRDAATGPTLPSALKS